MSTVSKTKIEWTDMVWNPVIGCKNKCPYCYARKIALRFSAVFGNFDKPHWKESNFIKSFPKNQSKIFVNSMSDICCWKKSWIEKIISKIKEYPQHTFLILTKGPAVYIDYKWPENVYLGITVTNENELTTYTDQFAFISHNKFFLSIEPIQEKIDLNYFYESDVGNVSWIIVGTETGNRKGKVIPRPEWIIDIVNYCYKNNIPLFMKDSLKNIYGELIKQFPEGLNE